MRNQNALRVSVRKGLLTNNKQIITPTMATKKSSKRTAPALSSTQKVGISVGLTATALAAVGGYFFYGSKDAAKNRRMAKSWMLKAKAEVLEGLESAQHMTKEEYETLVKKVVAGYKTAKNASPKELIEFAKNMHEQWKDIERATKSRAKKVVRKTMVQGSGMPRKKASK